MSWELSKRLCESRARLLQWQMLLLRAADMITVWMALRYDKCYLPGNLSCLTPSKDRLKLVK